MIIYFICIITCAKIKKILFFFALHFNNSSKLNITSNMESSMMYAYYNFMELF